MKLTTVGFSLICGGMVGFEYVDPDHAGAHTFIIDILFLRIMIQHGEIDA